MEFSVCKDDWGIIYHKIDPLLISQWRRAEKKNALQFSQSDVIMKSVIANCSWAVFVPRFKFSSNRKNGKNDKFWEFWRLLMGSDSPNGISCDPTTALEDGFGARITQMGFRVIRRRWRMGLDLGWPKWDSVWPDGAGGYLMCSDDPKRLRVTLVCWNILTILQHHQVSRYPIWAIWAHKQSSSTTRSHGIPFGPSEPISNPPATSGHTESHLGHPGP
jgi:hypothetical protein